MSLGPALLARADKHTVLIELLGPFFLGIVLNYLLWGVQITQSYHYYKSYRKTDRTWFKLAVGLLFVTDLIESICVTQTSWVFLVDGWGDENKITFFPGWGFYVTPLTDAFTASIVHFFYAQKIWTLLASPLNHIWTVVVIALSLTQLTGGLGGTVFLFSTHMSLLDFARFKTWASIWLVTAAVTDIVITGVMTMKLSMSRTGFKRTDDIISKLIRITVETGLATAVVQIIDIIIYLLWPLKSYHIVFAFVAPKVYSNSMLALLNSRQSRTNPVTSWHVASQSDRQAEGIHIHTTQTVAISDNYEMDEKIKTKASRLRPHDDQVTAPSVAPYNSFPFTTKDANYAA